MNMNSSSSMVFWGKKKGDKARRAQLAHLKEASRTCPPQLPRYNSAVVHRQQESYNVGPAATAPPKKNPDADSLRSYLSRLTNIGISFTQARPPVEARGGSWVPLYRASAGSVQPMTSPVSVSCVSQTQTLTAQQALVDQHAPEGVEQTIERARQDMASDVPSEEIDMDVDVEEVQSGPTQAELIALRLAAISDEELQAVKEIVHGRSATDGSMVIQKFSVDMKVSNMICLRPRTWLNDEIVNFYMAMLDQRDKILCKAAPARRPSHYFNSFFLDRLLDHGVYTYGNIKRWSKKFDVFAQDKVFMPINLNNTHWTLAVVFVQAKRIHYYDSMSGGGGRHLRAIQRWLEDESREKKKQTLDTADWQLVERESIPQQQNGFDCGVFSIICADFLSDNLPLSYSQEHMADFRLKIGAAIMRGALTY